jgi:uncharacterized Tic20 family protein
MPRKKKEELVDEPVAAPPEEVMPAEPAPPAEADLAPAAEVAAPALAPAARTVEERRMAAVAHGSILLNLVSGGLFGPLVALIVWLLYDRKSEYVSWHALQALVFQVISLLLFLVLGGVTAMLWAVTAVLIPAVVGFCLVPMVLGFSTVTVALLVGSLIYGCAGALAVLDGQDFRYRWVADWIPSLRRP